MKSTRNTLTPGRIVLKGICGALALAAIGAAPALAYAPAASAATPGQSVSRLGHGGDDLDLTGLLGLGTGFFGPEGRGIGVTRSGQTFVPIGEAG